MLIQNILFTVLITAKNCLLCPLNEKSKKHLQLYAVYGIIIFAFIERAKLRMEKIMKFKKLISSLTAAVSMSALAAFTAMCAFAEEAQEAPAATEAAKNTQQSSGGGWSFLISIVLMFLILYFIAIRPQKKRDKELKEMQSSLEVGDEIVTGGGIVGIVVRTGDDTVVIETGGERHKLRIKKWAITENVTAVERFKEMKAAAAAKKSDSAGVASAKLVDDDEDEADKKKSDKKKKKKDSDEE